MLTPMVMVGMHMAWEELVMVVVVVVVVSLQVPVHHLLRSLLLIAGSPHILPKYQHRRHHHRHPLPVALAVEMAAVRSVAVATMPLVQHRHIIDCILPWQWLMLVEEWEVEWEV